MATKTKKKPAKKSSNKKSSSKKKSTVKSKSTSKAARAKKKPAPKKKVTAAKTPTRGRSEDVQSVAYDPRGLRSRSAGQSGDLQGLSGGAEADTESVDELLEEGNAFEAEVVKGVEDVGDADEGEIHTHEVPEEDVPEEYFGDEDGGPSRRGKTAP
jgi:hypothetical protein